jgi:chitodextrinase
MAGALAALTVAVVAPGARAAAAADTTPPTAPTGLTWSATCAGVVTFTWTAATDDVGVTGYEVFREVSTGTFALAGTTTTTTFVEPRIAGLRYQVRARDAAGNTSPFTAPVIPVLPPCPPPDTQPPTTPGTPTASGPTATQITLSWAASTDNIRVIGYDIHRALGASGGTFAPVGTATATTFTDTGLTGGTTYRYRVRARDLAGNASPFSAPVTVTTPGGGGGCSATLTVQVGWNTGYVLQPITVTNSGATTPTAAACTSP